MDMGNTLFLSSTRVDLGKYRDVAVHVAQRLGMRVDYMEESGPDPRLAVEVCREKVRSASLFLGLYAYRYGHQPEGYAGTSITELEYEWAVEARIPVLLFMADEDHPWPPKNVDTGSDRKKLERFKERLRQKHVVAALTTPQRFHEDLFVFLPDFRKQVSARPSVSQSTIPLPPRKYIAHPYTLLQTRQVIGRARELALLDDWVRDPRSRLAAARVLSLVAIGGMGKSALAWKWMREHARSAMQPLAGRMWWSFYEADADFDRFTTCALAYCAGRPPQAVAEASRPEREAELLALLDQKPFLLVLDGVERLLIAYAGLDFAHLSDDDLDARTANAVAGVRGLPAGAAEAMPGQHRLRKTIDPHVGNFLRKLSQVQASRVLITTRLYPTVLQTETGHSLPGCDAEFLRGLEPADALALWRGMGVSGSDDGPAAVFATFEHYPLLIRALAGEVARFRRAPGDFDAWRRAHPAFDPFSLPLVQVRSHVLAHALGNLEADPREVLHMIAAFRSPVDYHTIVDLFRAAYGERVDEWLDRILTQLEDRGLLGWDRTNNRYDLHPVVRGVVWDGLDQASRHGIYDTLRSHFEAIPGVGAEARTATDIRPAMELFNALVGLGRFDEAVGLYSQRIDGFSFVNAGMLHQQIAMLESLFPDGLDAAPGFSRADFVYAQLGYAYSRVGRLGAALDCQRRSLRLKSSWFPTLGPSSPTLRSISKNELLLGRLYDALQDAGIAAMNAAAENVDGEETRQAEAELDFCKAVIGGSGQVTTTVLKLQMKDFYEAAFYTAQVSLWNGDYRTAVRAAQTSLRFATRVTELRLKSTIVLAEAELNLGRMTQAAALLGPVLREAVEKSLPLYELQARRVLAELYRREGELAKAREMLDDLWEMATRGGYRLVLADAYLVLAGVERDAGDRAAARDAACEAYRQAYCDGPGYTYYWALEKAAVLLKKLGAPVPPV
jgi:tetratricopeptide (TPR) repeat protein